jgi:AcrR family transcriptional regulator
MLMDKNTSQRITQIERTERSKAKIIEAANHYFAENGYHGTAMADIAKEAGLTGPGLLHHFPNKEELLIAVLEQRDQADQLRLTNLFNESRTPQMFDVLQNLVEHNQSTPEIVRLFTVLVTECIAVDHPGHDFFVERYRNYRHKYLYILQEYQQAGFIRKDIHIEQLSVLVMAVMDGLQIQWLLDPQEVDMVKSFTAFVQIMERGLQSGNK